MTDVFIRCFRPSDGRLSLRLSMAYVCTGRWNMQPDVRVIVLDGYQSDFHMNAKRSAERHATNDVYIVADDDCLILGADFVSRGLHTMWSVPSFGILTAASVIEHHRYTEDTTAPEIVEMHSVGGVAFVRKGILTEFPDCPPDKVDETICAEFKRKGYKTGFMPHVKFNHLGYGYSLSSQGLWMAPREEKSHRPQSRTDTPNPA